jgi:hypothetical protein
MALKVFNLKCDTGHLFEGWFGSHEDYDQQQSRGLITCPLCQSAHIEKMPSAPHVSVGRGRELAPAPQSTHDVMAGAGEEIAQMQALVLQRMREFVRAAENVGPRFAEEARMIHEGETDDRPIRGTASAEEQQELAEEGIAFVAVPDYLGNDQLQ